MKKKKYKVLIYDLPQEVEIEAKNEREAETRAVIDYSDSGYDEIYKVIVKKI